MIHHARWIALMIVGAGACAPGRPSSAPSGSAEPAGPPRVSEPRHAERDFYDEGLLDDCNEFVIPEPVPPPEGQQLVCGDGEVRTYAICNRIYEACTDSPASRVECETATEICDGDDFGGTSCESLGFARGTLTCNDTCMAYDISACDPCFGRGRRGVRCGRVPGASRIDGISIGARAAAIRWLEQTDERSAWHLAIIAKRGVTVVAPVATWAKGEPAVTVLDVVWHGGSWMVWYERDDHLWERRYRADGTPVGDERQIAAAVTELYIGVSAGGDRRAVGLVAGAPPRVFEIDRHGLGAALPPDEPIVARHGDDHLVVLPIAGATEGQADLAIVWSKPGRSGWWLFKEGRDFGSSSGSGADGVDLGFISGRLKVTYASDQVTTTWAPKGGAEWTVRHPVAAAPPADLLAQHSTVTGHRAVAAGRTGLAAAVFQPRGAEPTIVTALVTK